MSIGIKGTNRGTTTDFEGNFCFVIPEKEILFLSISPSCFGIETLCKIEPKDQNIRIVYKGDQVDIEIDGKKQSNRKALREWKKNKEIVVSRLHDIYDPYDKDSAQSKILCKIQ